jgi:hypothetical protein
VDKSSKKAQPKISGPALLVFRVGTVMAVVAAIVAAVLVGGGGGPVQSNLILRMLAASITGGTVYSGVLLAVWAIEGKPPEKLNVPHGLGLEESDEEARNDVRQGLDELEAMMRRAERAEGIIEALRSQLDTTTRDVERLSGENQRLAYENTGLRARREGVPEQKPRVTRAKRTNIDPDR